MSDYVLPFPKSNISKGGEFGTKVGRVTAHRGVDGTPEFAIAVADAVVAMNRWSDVLGWVLVIKDKKDTFWGYCHLRAASKFTVGMKVKVGQKLGVTGNTGSASRGRHLHFTCGYDVNAVFWGTTVDGIKVLEKRIALQTVTAPKPVVEAELVVEVAEVKPAPAKSLYSNSKKKGK